MAIRTPVLVAVALLALMCVADAGGKAKPKPAPKNSKKPPVDVWCAKSTPAKCGTWGKADNEKTARVCGTDCLGGGICTLKPNAKSQAGKCCSCVMSFDSDFCACGGKDAVDATYCSSATPDAANVCLSCKAEVCRAACAAGQAAGIPFTFDPATLAGVDPLAGSCPTGPYTCDTC